MEFTEQNTNNKLDSIAERGQIDEFEKMVAFGAKITPDTMYNASRSGNLDMVKAVISQGCLFLQMGIRGAAEMGHLELVKYFLETWPEYPRNPHIAVTYATKHGHVNIIEYLYENCDTFYYETVLEGAQKYGHENLLNFLQSTYRSTK